MILWFKKFDAVVMLQNMIGRNNYNIQNAEVQQPVSNSHY